MTPNPEFALAKGMVLQRRIEQIIAHQFHGCSGWWTNAEPIQTQSIATSDPVLRIQRQEFCQRFFLTPIGQVTLKLSDNQRESRYLCRKVT